MKEDEISTDFLSNELFTSPARLTSEPHHHNNSHQAKKQRNKETTTTSTTRRRRIRREEEDLFTLRRGEPLLQLGDELQPANLGCQEQLPSVPSGSQVVWLRGMALSMWWRSPGDTKGVAERNSISLLFEL